jgi:hypothetical protein
VQPGSYKTVNVITQETFEKFTPPRPTITNPEKPPKPPSSSLVDEINQVKIVSNNIYDFVF